MKKQLSGLMLAAAVVALCAQPASAKAMKETTSEKMESKQAEMAERMVEKKVRMEERMEEKKVRMEERVEAMKLKKAEMKTKLEEMKAGRDANQLKHRASILKKQLDQMVAVYTVKKDKLNERVTQQKSKGYDVVAAEAALNDLMVQLTAVADLSNKVSADGVTQDMLKTYMTQAHELRKKAISAVNTAKKALNMTSALHSGEGKKMGIKKMME